MNWKKLLLILLLVGSLTAMIGCESAYLADAGPSSDSFVINGLLVKSNDLGKTDLMVELFRNGSLSSDGALSFGGQSLAFSSNGWAVPSTFGYTNAAADFFPQGFYTLRLFDPNFAVDTASVKVGTVMSVLTVNPFNRLILGNGTATLTWNQTTNIDGWVIAAVKDGMEYTGAGWSGYVDFGVNQGTIPPDAFLSSNGVDPDTGLYNLYVYGYSGAPDSTLGAALLPVPFPSQFPDNVNRPALEGRFGTVLISASDTVRVSLQ